MYLEKQPLPIDDGQRQKTLLIVQETAVSMAIEPPLNLVEENALVGLALGTHYTKEDELTRYQIASAKDRKILGAHVDERWLVLRGVLQVVKEKLA